MKQLLKTFDKTSVEHKTMLFFIFKYEINLIEEQYSIDDGIFIDVLSFLEIMFELPYYLHTCTYIH